MFSRYSSWLTVACAGLVLLAAGSLAQGAIITINPDTLDRWLVYGKTANLSLDEVAEEVGYSGELTSAYKADIDDKNNFVVVESGPYAVNYETTYDPPNDPDSAEIKWMGGDFISAIDYQVYLIVKDGQADPSQYIFDLTNLTANVSIDPTVDLPYSWNGTDTLNLVGFWPQNGAISHVEIVYGERNPDPAPAIPEPATFAIWSALAACGAVAGFRRRRLRKNQA